ncbi:MAG: 50S ribosomal protein L24 [Thermoanaerobaculia bacterium]|nr:50S ribosomal protein L24 [Thermoanaerobaculia bacterium]
MMKAKIKKGDEVLVIAGRSKGVRAKVLRVLPQKNAAIVERVNMVKKHERANPQQQIQGGILEREAPIDLSNLKLIDPETGQPTRVGRKRLEDGSAARVSKKSGAVFN